MSGPPNPPANDHDIQRAHTVLRHVSAAVWCWPTPSCHNCVCSLPRTCSSLSVLTVNAGLSADTVHDNTLPELSLPAFHRISYVQQTPTRQRLAAEHTDRQTNRHTVRQTNWQTDRNRHSQTDKLTDGQEQTQTVRQTDRHSDRQ